MSNCGSFYGSYADYYKSYFGNNYPYMGYGQNNGCACSSCANAGGGAYAGYPYGSDSCCGGGFAAGPGLYDSRCFIPITLDDCAPAGGARTTTRTSISDEIGSIITGDEDAIDGSTYTTYDTTIDETNVDTCEEITAFGGGHNAGELDQALCGQLHNNLVPINSMDAHLGVRLYEDGIRIDRDGTYEIRLFGNFSYSENSYIEWHIYADEQALDSTAASMNAYANETRSFERTAIIYLNAGTVLHVYASPEEKGTLYVRPNGVSITLKKLSN
ncbi:MAG: hypothetical protein LBS72_09140 [Oscillospiraceae bacterium]|jgi:hypothetical protein|nr:hypothetical protein [Oscillospiraceae bacterium]